MDIIIIENPIKMCIKSAPYLHQKSVIRHYIWHFFNALMLLTKFVPNSMAPLEGAVPASIFNYDAKFAPNILQICPKQHHCAIARITKLSRPRFSKTLYLRFKNKDLG